MTADSRHGPAVGDHIPNREFHAEQAGTKWVSSYQRYAITRLRSGGDWVFLTAAFDLYDRNVIGRAFSADMETVYTAIPAMEMACANRKARKGLLFQSDRGCGIARNPFVNIRGTLSHGSPEHEPERELPE